MSTCRVDVDQFSPVFALTLAGEFDWDQRDLLDEAITRFADTAARQALVDLTLVTYLDSSGLAALARLAAQVADRGGNVTLIGVSPSVLRVLQLTSLVDLFDISSATRSSRPH